MKHDYNFLLEEMFGSGWPLPMCVTMSSMHHLSDC